MTHSILAVVVTYNPECGALAQTLSVLTDPSTIPSTTTSISQDERPSSFVVDYVIVDNGSDNAEQIQSLVAEPTTQFVALKRNYGLGYAHNEGIAIAKQRAFSHVLLLDQDSLPQPNMIGNLVNAYESLTCSDTDKSSTKVSAVGSCYLNSDNHSGSFFVKFGKLKFQRQYCPAKYSGIEIETVQSKAIQTQNIHAEAGLVEADFLISSGSLISLQALGEIGPMDDALFIDHIDTEWFLRAKNLGFKAFGVCDSLMQHSLGDKTHQLNIAGRQRNVPQHKPFRYYYIFRNSVALYKRGYVSSLWKWNDIQRLVMIAIMYGLVTGPRMQNLSMMCKGIWHGVIGKMGKLND